PHSTSAASGGPGTGTATGPRSSISGPSSASRGGGRGRRGRRPRPRFLRGSLQGLNRVLPTNKVRVMWHRVRRLLSRGPGAPVSSGRGRREQSRFGPGVEGLEGRRVPAIIVVTTFADVVNPGDEKVSLREAINLANATAAPDTIVLRPGVYRIGL